MKILYIANKKYIKSKIRVFEKYIKRIFFE